MRLQWKYALIINLSVLAILATFYVIDEIKARDDLSQLHVRGVEIGAIFKGITETVIRSCIEDKIAPRQAFYRDEIESALRALKQQTLEMRDVVDINVTFGLDTTIQASLVPGKSEDDHINLKDEDLDEIKRNGVTVYKTPPIDGKYVTAITIPYRAESITPTDWLVLFGAQLTYQTELDNGNISEGLRSAFKNNGILLSQRVDVSTKQEDREWMITDARNGHRYFVWKDEDRLSDIYYEPKLMSVAKAEEELGEFEIDGNYEKTLGGLKVVHESHKGRAINDAKEDFEIIVED